MKKLAALPLTTIALVGLAACGSSTPEPDAFYEATLSDGGTVTVSIDLSEEYVSVELDNSDGTSPSDLGGVVVWADDDTPYEFEPAEGASVEPGATETFELEIRDREVDEELGVESVEVYGPDDSDFIPAHEVSP